ncbi:hypothetical protein NSU_4182 [Novosphingobium pentaromativorans US6-1]|uniref:Uncharacterized protein n=1 Tax=Novosphingobium pentaromativorans US6-1 TaxID=1088721 RepID=G6EIL1_9SPHN|nr:hypothetical protein NSU_4182 [Novosphingobium pentaromativorans US6-1]
MRFPLQATLREVAVFLLRGALEHSFVMRQAFAACSAISMA